MARIFRLLAIAAVCFCLGALIAPWKLTTAKVEAGIATQIQRSTGWAPRIAGPVTIKLLPRPRLQIADLALSDDSGGFQLHSTSLNGDIDVGELLSGRWRLTSATLVSPTVTVDTAALDLPAFDSEALKQSEALVPFRLSMRAGLLRIKAGDSPFDTLVTDIDGTAERTAGGGLTLAGSALWHGLSGRVTGRLERLAALADGTTTSASLQMVSPVGTFIASGEVSGTDDREFVGRVAAASPSLPPLLRALGLAGPTRGIERAALNGDAVFKSGDLSLSDLRLKLDRSLFEGTLALRSQATGRLVEGTLATDRLDLDALGRAYASERDQAALPGQQLGRRLLPLDLDFRISASTATLGSATIQDAALSAMLRDGAFEIALDEAHLYDGVLKGRAEGRLELDGIDGRASLSVTGLALGPLSNAAAGESRITGTLSGQLDLAARGATMRDLLHSVGGHGELTVENGNFMGLSVTQAMRRLARKLPVDPDTSAQITAFDLATTRFDLTHGIVTLTEGVVKGPGMHLNFGGRTDLPHGRIQIDAVAAGTDAAGTVPLGSPHVPFQMRGLLGGPLVIVDKSDRGSALGLPLVVTPTLPAQSLTLP